MSDRTMFRGLAGLGILLILALAITQEAEWWIWMGFVVLSSLTTLAIVALTELDEWERREKELRVRRELAQDYLDKHMPGHDYTWQKTKRIDKSHPSWNQWNKPRPENKPHYKWDDWKWEDGK